MEDLGGGQLLSGRGMDSAAPELEALAHRPLQGRAEAVYLLLAALFVSALVVCNLIANKFVEVDLSLFGIHKTFILSAGVLPYPITFLVTDLLSEIYGRRRANRVVLGGFAASIFVLGVLWLGDQFPAISGTIVDDATYSTVFRNAWRVIGASMVAYLAAQFVDIRLFHFWKRLTRGRHLWLRNNASTVVSQLLDTTLVVSVLFVGSERGGDIPRMILDGWMFKAGIALLDTPLFYLATFGLQRWLGLDRPGGARQTA